MAVILICIVYAVYKSTLGFIITMLKWDLYDIVFVLWLTKVTIPSFKSQDWQHDSAAELTICARKANISVC